MELAGDADPVQAVTEQARLLTMKAMQEGWSGPPYDPFALAEYMKIAVVAREDIPEARTVSSRSGYVIEFNPNRPRNRIRFSVCHELAHTLFPDCHERIRNRVTHRDTKGDDWQLETLCNIGAAELIMPIGSMAGSEGERLTIDGILEARKRYEVSSEAVLLRAIRITMDQCSAFSSSRRGVGGRYQIDYAVPSRAWSGELNAGAALPSPSVASECTAIGFTAKGHEIWDSVGPVRVECLGVAPYPNQNYPRVVGIVRPQKSIPVDVAQITFLQGDAGQPRGSGERIVAQLVNDSAFTWGGGFSLLVREKWPAAQRAFRAWAEHERRNLRLGNVHFGKAVENVTIASLIAQHGYGPSPRPRIRYVALRTCLEQLGRYAAEREATVHMPRIGSGQAGGSWNVIRELVQDAVCSQNVKVFVYDLPGRKPGPSHPQGAFEFS